MREKKKTADVLRRELTSKQIAFAEAYIQCNNATEAAASAGYSAKTAASQGSRMLKNAKVTAYIRARFIDLYDKAGISPEWVGLKLKEVVERCMEATPHLTWDSATHAWVPDGTWRFDAKGAVSALQAIGRSLGMFSEHHGTEPGGGETIEELLARMEKEAAT